MKIRIGFVSNSSSSSFIVKLERPIEEYTLEEFKEYLQPSEILEYIYNELKQSTKLEDNLYELWLSNEGSEEECEAKNYMLDRRNSLEYKGIIKDDD